jgi:hypothetical protein
VSRIQVLRTAVGSMITGLQTMPSIAWFPLAILLFKLSEAAILFVVVIGAAPAIANGLIAGSDNLPPLLVRAGRITEHQAQGHPMRNYVECCIGGDPILPEMTLSGRRALVPGDVLMLCSDGLWSGVSDEALASLSTSPRDHLRQALAALGEQAVSNSAPYADNTSAVAVRWRGP